MKFSIDIKAQGRRWEFYTTISDPVQAMIHREMPGTIGLVGRFRVREVADATDKEIRYFVTKFLTKIGSARLNIVRGWCEGIGEFTWQEQQRVLFRIGDAGGISNHIPKEGE